MNANSAWAPDSGNVRAMNDPDLQRCLAEGEAGFESLVKRYSALVYATALRRVNNPSLAEEITQSVFIILHQKLPGINARVSILGWLIRATRFVAHRAAKAEARRRANEAAAMQHFEIVAEPDASAAVYPLLGEAIVALKPNEQRCVVARFFDEASFKEIAGTERISEDAAQKRVTRALEKMRSFLARRGLKIAGAAGLTAMLAQSSQAADPALVSGILHSVAAAKTAGASTGISLLAKKAAAIFEWKNRALLVVKIAGVALLVATPPAVFVVERKPPIPAAVAMPQAPASLADLARRWSSVVREVTGMLKTPPPAANTPAAVRYNNAYNRLINESDQIINLLNDSLTPQNERQAVAQFLTVELAENLALNASQRAFIYQHILDSLNAPAATKDALNQLYDTRATHAQQLRAMLSIRQRWAFDSIYGANGLGLFSAAPTLAAGR